MTFAYLKTIIYIMDENDIHQFNDYISNNQYFHAYILIFSKFVDSQDDEKAEIEE